MPVQATIWTPVCSATRAMKWTSRPPNIAVGSTIVRTPQSLAALTASSAAASSAPASYRLGPLAATASSRKRTCSWIRTVPSSPASTGPCTVCTCAIVVLPARSAERRAPLGLVAQLRLENLAGRIARQRFVAQRDVLRHLEVRHALARMGEDGLDVEALAVVGHDHDPDLLAHHVVGDADRDNLADAGRAGQRALDLDRVDVLAAAVDHVLLAIDDVEQPVLVDPAEVAGVQPAADEGLLRGVGVVPVALHDVGPADQQLADAGLGVGPVDREIDDGHREADGVRVLGGLLVGEVARQRGS